MKKKVLPKKIKKESDKCSLFCFSKSIVLKSLNNDCECLIKAWVFKCV